MASKEEIQEQYSNALVLREIADKQVAYWKRQLDGVSGGPVKKRKQPAQQISLAQFKANIITGKRPGPKKKIA